MYLISRLLFILLHIIILQLENLFVSLKEVNMKDNLSASSKEIKNALNNLKVEVASELGVDLKDVNLTSRDAGRVGGQMVKKLIEKAENQMK